jgi:hypothetical protein
MTFSAVVLVVLGIMWLCSLPWPSTPVPGWASNLVAFLFCVTLALHVYHVGPFAA